MTSKKINRKITTSSWFENVWLGIKLSGSATLQFYIWCKNFVTQKQSLVKLWSFLLDSIWCRYGFFVYTVPVNLPESVRFLKFSFCPSPGMTRPTWTPCWRPSSPWRWRAWSRGPANSSLLVSYATGIVMVPVLHLITKLKPSFLISLVASVNLGQKIII